jgi:hypothetical protein
MIFIIPDFDRHCCDYLQSVTVRALANLNWKKISKNCKRNSDTAEQFQSLKIQEELEKLKLDIQYLTKCANVLR